MKLLSFARYVGAFGIVVFLAGCGKDREAGKDTDNGVIDPVCWPCGSPLLGEVTFAGNVKIDGKFLAAVEMNRDALAIARELDHHVDALMLEFGASAPESASTGDKLGALVTSIQNEVDANVGSPIVVEYVPSTCAAEVRMAIEAQAQCEARAECSLSDPIEPDTVGAACGGTCDGICDGSCSESCTGRCSGTVIPPTLSPGCEAGTACHGQAQLRAAAALSCTPALLTLSWSGSSATEEFDGKMAALRRYGTAILEDAARLSALLTGRIDAEVVFDESPVEQLVQSLEEDLDHGVEGELFEGIDVYRVSCTIGAYVDAIELVKEMGTRHVSTMEAQASFRAALTSGFAR